MEAQSTPSPQLVEALIEEEILPRLPVKSLLRFRCVSKSWRSLIASTRFITTHYAKTQLGHDCWKVILYCDKHGLNQHGPNQGSFSSFVYGPYLGPFPIDDPKNDHLMTDSRVVDLCHGLFCIYKKPGCFFLWNPATRISHELPKLDLQNLPIKKWGFGWDEQSRAYKAFVGMSDQNQRMTHIYSCKTNSWKTIQHGSLPLFNTGGFSCGKIHWVIKRSGKETYIETLDLEREVFGTMELPCKVEDASRVSLCMEVDGCFSVLYADKEHKRKHIWVMKEYGVKESWVETSYRYRWKRVVVRCCMPSPYIESLVSPLPE